VPEHPDADALAGAALGGRVVHSGFLEPREADALVAALKRPGVAVAVTGGVPAARRRVVIAYPEHLPSASVPMAAVYVEGASDGEALRSAARVAGVDAAALGDVVTHRDGISLITLAPPPAALLGLRRLQERVVAPVTVPLERVATGTEREFEAVVPSLRVDVLGGKAFRVSRSYFAKGVAAGRVSVNGRVADKGATAAAGDEVYADGLGRFRVLRVEGTTRRGNLRVTIRAERG
jgi:RNA-binding protein YlmH